MSILLDALRKSEAQRRLGEIPTLQTNVSADDGRSADRQNWIPLALILLSAAIMSWTGIKQFQEVESAPAMAEREEASPAVAEEQPATDTVPKRARAAGRKDSSARTRSQATTPVKDYVDEKPDASEDEAAEAPSRRVAHVEVGKDPSAGTRPRPAAVENSAAAEAASIESQAESQAQPQAAEPAAYAPQTINYWQMPQSLREQMGEFKISVMVYAENPAERFLLLNGSRLREQQKTDGGIRLEEIQRDRAVFSFKDYRFHVTN